MIELAQHIEALLLENDCVIVPGLGGFVAHYTSARRVAEENLFLPPTRIIGFNPQLKMNDGLLVQSYMAVYGTSFSDATKQVDKTVANLLVLLHEEGKADLPNVGELRYSIRDTYSFIPYDDKITTPYLYGFDSFEMEELPHVRQIAQKPIPLQIPAVAEEHVEQGEKRHFEIRINRSYWVSAAAMIAIIALFFSLSTPIENTEIMETNYASLLPSELFERMEKQSLAMTPVTVQQQQSGKKKTQSNSATSTQKKPVVPVAVKEVKVEKPKETSPAPANTQENKQPQPAKAETRKPYHIIVASMNTEKDANAMAKKLVEKGFPEAQAIIGDGRMRVCIQSFATQAEAYRALANIRKDETYQNAWVLKK